MEALITPGLVISLIVVAVGVFVIAKGLVIIRQSEVMVIERLGSFNRVLESGINIIIPFIEKPRPISMIRYMRMGDEYHPVTTDEVRIDRRDRDGLSRPAGGHHRQRYGENQRCALLPDHRPSPGRIRSREYEPGG